MHTNGGVDVTVVISCMTIYFGPVAVMPDFNPNSAANRIKTTLSEWQDKLDALQEKADSLQEWWDDFRKVTGISDSEDDLEDLQKKVKDLDPGAARLTV